MQLSKIRRSIACVALPIALPVALALLSGCTSGRSVSLSSPETLFGLLQPYEVDVVQGNVVTQEVMAQIQPGLGRPQVREILGSPLLADVFHGDRWDYVFTIRRQGVPAQERRVTVFFKNDVVDHFEAGALPSEREFVASIDKPVARKSIAPDLTPTQIAALPVPPKTDVAQQGPQGAVRSYPPLEAGHP